MGKKKAKRVTINLEEVIVRSDGTMATMEEFVKEMLFYNPDFYIEETNEGESWFLKRKEESLE
jgi:hypothetical protein